MCGNGATPTAGPPRDAGSPPGRTRRQVYRRRLASLVVCGVLRHRLLPGWPEARFPRPLRDSRIVLAVLTRVTTRCQPYVGHPLAQHRSTAGQTVDAVDDVHDEMEAIQIVQHHHVERGRGGAALLEPSHMHVRV